MNQILKHLLGVLLTTLTLSCHRQELEDPNLYLAQIPITIDWSESYIDEEYTTNVSVYFFPMDGSSPYIMISENIYYALAKVPIGDYSIMVFNDTETNLLGISFDGTSTHDDFRANIKQSSSSDMYYTPDDNDFMVTKHDRIAAWNLGEFSVTNEMVEYTCSTDFDVYIEEMRSRAETISRGDQPTRSLDTISELMPETTTKSVTNYLESVTDVKPQPVTERNTIKVRIKNLSNAIKAEGVLRGSASGAMMKSNERTLSGETINSYQFEFTSAEYDTEAGSTQNGYITHSLDTFGKQSEDSYYELVVDILTSTGVKYTFVRDVTAQVNESDNFNIDIAIDGDGDEGEIVLPEGGDSSFGVNEWKENEFELL